MESSRREPVEMKSVEMKSVGVDLEEASAASPRGSASDYTVMYGNMITMQLKWGAESKEEIPAFRAITSKGGWAVFPLSRAELGNAWTDEASMKAWECREKPQSILSVRAALER